MPASDSNTPNTASAMPPALSPMAPPAPRMMPSATRETVQGVSRDARRSAADRMPLMQNAATTSTSRTIPLLISDAEENPSATAAAAAHTDTFV